MSHTFGSTAAAWIAGLEQRKRKPCSPATLSTYKQHITRLLPLVGADTPLSTIDNGVLRRLANDIQGSPKTINETLMALKAIIASAIDPSTGNEVFPRKWNSTFIDAPTITTQRQPCVTAKDIETAIRTSRTWSEQLLYAILASSGLRISEALAIRVGGPEAELHKGSDGEIDVTAFLETEKLIRVRSTMFKNVEHPGKTKTASSRRDVDLDERLPHRIMEFIKAQKIEPGQFLFQSEIPGSVMNLETAARRLRKRGIPGFHSFRRYRITHLRQARIPEDLIVFWSGHSNRSITDRYDKAASDIEYRRKHAELAGTGFDLQALGSPKRERKNRPRFERLIKVHSTPAAPVYHAVAEDIPF